MTVAWIRFLGTNVSHSSAVATASAISGITALRQAWKAHFDLIGHGTYAVYVLGSRAQSTTAQRRWLAALTLLMFQFSREGACGIRGADIKVRTRCA